MKITIQDLHVMLARIEERQITVVEKIDNITTRQDEHESNDNKQFSILNKNINRMLKYCASIAIVAGAIGYIMG